jgi:uncharacterized coiled-coil DUF342 family protein
MMEAPQRTLVVLLTMHRSGSSAATSILNRLGLSLGPFELIGATPSNPHGHFESLPILELNKDVQKLVYGFSEDLPESEEALDNFVASQGAGNWREIPTDLVSRGRSIIENLIESGEIAGFKDPRTVLLWPFWSRVLADFPEVRVAPIALLRSPHEIAMSLCARSFASGGVHAYWDCLDMVAIHYSRLKQIVDNWNEPIPFVRFGMPSFMDDLAVTTRRCGLVWDAEKASEMLDSACIHQLAARVPHKAQDLYDSLCGQCAIFDPQANQARLNADSRECERMVWRRVRRSESAAKSTLELLVATQNTLTESQADLRQTQDALFRAHEQLREVHDQVRAAHDQLRAAHEQVSGTNDQLRAAHQRVSETNDQLRATQQQVSEVTGQLHAAHEQVSDTHDQLREAHDQVSDAHYRLREAYEQLREAHDQARQLSQELRETYEQFHGTQTHNAMLMESIRQTNLTLEQSNLEVHDLEQLCNEQRQHLAKFEGHPLLGVALRGRRSLRRALNTLKLRSAG